MTRKIALILWMIIFLTSVKIQCKFEKIKFSLTSYEITNVTDIHLRRAEYLTWGDSERSVQIKAFGKVFILDLTAYFPREDSEVEYISKLKNVTDSFLSSNLLLYHGYLRGVQNSSVVGFFPREKLFRGYIFTNEVYCIEPYNEKNYSLIVYRFKDVIVPGCSKMGEENLDCTETMYFTPWKANKPPPKQVPSTSYSLFYDKYMEIFNRKFQAKTEDDNKRNTEDQIDKDKNKAGTRSKSKPSSSNQTEHSDKSNKTRDKVHDEVQNKTRQEKGNANKKNKHDKNKTESGKSNEDKDDNDEKDKEDDDRYIIRENVISLIKSAEIENNSSNGTSKGDAEHSMANLYQNISSLKSSGVPKENLNDEETNGNDESDTSLPIIEALEENISEQQCNVEIVVSPSIRKKFGYSDESILKDIHTQFTLLNRILRKVTLKKKDEPFHLHLNVERIVIYSDEVYSPFNMGESLENLVKIHRQKRPFCLTIGLMNRFLISGQLFDGYIPEGGGGVCASSGNLFIVSHGNDNTPVPMALFFAALVRGLTRALGANDRDAQCEVGSHPNPMQVLRDYLLTKEAISPSQESSIFTSCNVQEITRALRGRECFLRISKPLCGNGILDEGEECDCGPAYHCNRIDPCCNAPQTVAGLNKGKSQKDKGCTLIKGAKCSLKQECCSVCDINKEESFCFSGNDVCDIGKCDGKSAKCPTGADASNGLICSGGYNETATEPLICKDSKCDLALCTGHGLKPCTCALGTGKDCVYCCVKNGKCRAAGQDLNLVAGRKFQMPDGTGCIGGECLSGKCVPVSGMNQIFNYTVLKPPMFPPKENSCNSLLTLNSIVSAVLCFLLMLLL